MKPVVLVCGAYKSGTSLAAKLCESLGFFNPADLSNPAELGYGMDRSRYSTRECTVFRHANLLLRRTD
ncbi:MAG: hypothetical protein ABI333_14645, partial [bacterium]